MNNKLPRLKSRSILKFVFRLHPPEVTSGGILAQNKKKKNLMTKIRQLISKKEFLVLLLIWCGGFFLRVYRLDDLLGFYYDQGRDALRAVDILSLKDLPAVGPTTGLSGIFLGPFWFYFIALFYWLGRGDPAIAAAFIGFLDSLTAILLYLIAKKFLSARIGVFSAIIWSFSYGLVKSARWFSNPSPMPFFTMLLLLSLGGWLINKNKKWLLSIFLFLAITTQLEVASAVFYYPAILIMIVLWIGLDKEKRQKLLFNKYLFFGVIIFLISLIPQLLFEVKNSFLMTKNLMGFLTGSVNTHIGKSWIIPNSKIIIQRLEYYHSAFFSNLEINLNKTVIFALPFFLWFLWGLISKIYRKNFNFEFLLEVFLIVPIVALLFFVGNYGNLYDYYLTGFFPVFVLLFSLFLNKFLKFKWLFFVPLGFFTWFLWGNGIFLKNYLSAGVDGYNHISLGNQKQAINWLCENREEKEFNIDTYVPSVIPYSWDYLWQWYGCKKLGCCPAEDLKPLLYTIYEVDPPHPERLEQWFERQEGIGKITEEIQFGGIGVQKRTRFNNQN